MDTWASHSKNEGVLRKIGVLAAKVLDLFLIPITEMVKTQAVLLRVHDGTEHSLQFAALCRIQQALKNRALYSLPVIDALLCNFPQAFLPGGILRVDIISDQDKQNVSLP